MIFSLKRLVIKYKLNIRGVLHIGAHWGQEFSEYDELRIKNMLFFEPVEANYKKLLETLPKHRKKIQALKIALGNKKELKEMYVETRKGQSCSLLEPGLHLKQYPHIVFDTREMVQVDRLDNIEFSRQWFNMINIDVQGYELEVLKGSVETLKSIDIIYTEINRVELYKGGCLMKDLDDFLRPFGFIRVQTKTPEKTWGDAMYLKYG